MATTNFTTLYARGDQWLEDADNFAFTPVVKTEALQSIINDDYYVSLVVRDSSLTTVAQQAAYSVDSSYSSILSVYLDVLGDGYGHQIDRSAWEFDNGQIIFRPRYKGLPGGKTLILRAHKKLTVTDTFDELLASYILHMYCAQMLRVLAHRKTGRFLRNQTSMAEIVASMQEHKQEAQRLRGLLPNRRDVVL